MSYAMFRCIIWNNVYFVGIYLFYLPKHTAPINSTIRRHSLSITPTRQTMKDGALSGVSQSWWGGSWLRLKSPGFGYSLAIHYCTQSVWAISLDLNIVPANTTTTMGLFVAYCRYTVIIYMVSYQYFSYLYYLKMHIRRCICCYFPFTYNNFPIFYVLF